MAQGMTAQVNWKIHKLFANSRYLECEKVIDQALAEAGPADYPLLVRGMIQRSGGRIDDCLQSLRSLESPSLAAKKLLLNGEISQALQVSEDLVLVDADWEAWFLRGKCFFQSGEYEKAVESFQKACNMQKTVTALVELGYTYMKLEQYKQALASYKEALQVDATSGDALRALAQLYVLAGENGKAYDLLQTCVADNPSDAEVLLALGSIIQDSGEPQIALSKYQHLAQQGIQHAGLWNNIAMCLHSTRKYTASVACLQRALRLTPLDWMILFNLGITHICTQQYASAFRYLSASINIKPDFPATFMYLAIALDRLGDVDNARVAYGKALSLGGDYLVELNYAITLYKHSLQQEAKQHFTIAEKYMESARELEPEVRAQAEALRKELQRY